MKLSYIIPVYNVEKYLRQCLDSILSQTMDDYEVILVDDESPDNCPAICDEYKEKYPDIFKVIHKKNEGCVIARIEGMKYAAGEYIFFADSDDYLISDSMAELYRIASSNNLDMLETSYYSGWDGKKTEKIDSQLPLNRLLNHSDMEKELCYAFSHSLLVFLWKNLYRREFLLNNGIDFDRQLRMAGDPPYNMWAYSKAERFMAVDVPVYFYRIRDNSLQRQKYIEDYDLLINYQWSLKIKYYSENCKENQLFYKDCAEYSVKSLLPMLLNRAYKNKVPERFRLLKRIGNSEMMRRSFKDYDINAFKSKSLDWLMTWCVKHKLYLAAHILCDKVLYK